MAVGENKVNPGRPSQIPSWAKKYILPETFERVEAAIKKVEKSTSGEVVVMVVKRSTFIETNFMLMAMVWVGLVSIIEIVGLKLGYNFDWLWIPTVIGLVVGKLFAEKLEPLATLLTSRQDVVGQTMVRAQLEFYRARLNRTEKKTGVLIFCSLAERRAVIWGDEGIASKLSGEVWSEILHRLILSIKQGQMTQGLENAVASVGELLYPHFPRENDDKDELNNQLVVME